MDLVSLLIAIIIVGAIVYLIDLVPIDPTFKAIVKVIAIVGLAIWLLRAFAPMIGLG